MGSTQQYRPARPTWRLPLLSGASICALLISGAPVVARAAEANARGAAEVEEVVVTGSFLASTLESQAQPVETISASDIKAKGNVALVFGGEGNDTIAIDTVGSIVEQLIGTKATAADIKAAVSGVAKQGA